MKKIMILGIFILIIGGLTGCGMNNENTGHASTMDQMMGHDSNVRLHDSKGINELTFPSVLKPDKRDKNHVTYTVHAMQGEATFFPGTKTNTYGYNGNYLGPVIRLKSGMNVTINLINNLKTGTTFHWHGLEVPGVVDGGPTQIIKPGKKRTIHFKVKQDAATLWYHPHPMHQTAKQVYKGLAGLLYIDNPDQRNLNIPHTYGVDDLPIILQDRTFSDDNQLDYEAVKNADGTTGETLLINGTVNPKLTTKHQKIRLRILNGSNKRNYTLHFDNNMTFSQIASDGGFLNKAYQTKQLEISPAERVEIVADFSEIREKDVKLMDEGTTLLPIHLLGKAKTDSTTINITNNINITDKLRNKDVTKEIKLAGMGTHATINGKKYDPERIDFTQKVGQTEVWEINNVKDMMGGMKHPFHIHGTQFRVISVDGKEPPKQLSGLKDTITLDPGQKAKIAVTFPEKGIYMFHCHILEHEDNGMMGQIKVVN